MYQSLAQELKDGPSSDGFVGRVFFQHKFPTIDLEETVVKTTDDTTPERLSIRLDAMNLVSRMCAADVFNCISLSRWLLKTISSVVFHTDVIRSIVSVIGSRKVLSLYAGVGFWEAALIHYGLPRDNIIATDKFEARWFADLFPDCRIPEGFSFTDSVSRVDPELVADYAPWGVKIHCMDALTAIRGNPDVDVLFMIDPPSTNSDILQVLDVFRGSLMISCFGSGKNIAETDFIHKANSIGWDVVGQWVTGPDNILIWSKPSLTDEEMKIWQDIRSMHEVPAEGPAEDDSEHPTA